MVHESIDIMFQLELILDFSLIILDQKLIKLVCEI
jgi:hypothetical protein